MNRTAPKSCVLECRERLLRFEERTLVMGILNVTPDSFSDGGQFLNHDAAVAHALRMIAEGASAIDIGGQSTRPGYAEISAAEEIERVVPVIERLRRETSTVISIDTYKAAVARAALEAGAHILNDVHGLQGDPELAQIAAHFRCPVIVMHQEKTFREEAGDTLDKLRRFFDRSVAIAEAAGIASEQIVFDPGIGFFKTLEQNLEIIARLGEIRRWGFPVLLGASRKSSIGQVLDLPAEQRLEGTLATTSVAAWQGVEMVRVHDVQPNVRTAKMIAAIRATILP
ncbi:MAG TPA: dihydropteroate synthase [Opitutaceae bacterium]|nr:dihydropteroate synthase [Opitutaceae bacterium]